jgi:hypothetical protein
MRLSASDSKRRVLLTLVPVALTIVFVYVAYTDFHLNRNSEFYQKVSTVGYWWYFALSPIALGLSLYPPNFVISDLLCCHLVLGKIDPFEGKLSEDSF